MSVDVTNMYKFAYVRVDLGSPLSTEAVPAICNSQTFYMKQDTYHTSCAYTYEKWYPD